MYNKPMIISNEDMAEGVYVASGSAICWSGYAQSVQDWNGSHHVFELRIQHSTEVVHISQGVTIKMPISGGTVIGCYTENNWPCSVEGNTITVTRPQHANAYNSGDTVTFKVWVQAVDEATTKALSCGALTFVSCDKVPNVQGGMD